MCAQMQDAVFIMLETHVHAHSSQIGRIRCFKIACTQCSKASLHSLYVRKDIRAIVYEKKYVLGERSEWCQNWATMHDLTCVGVRRR